MNRRLLVLLSLVIMVSMLLAACGGGAPAPAAESGGEEAAMEEAPAEEAAAAGAADEDVPRNKTLIVADMTPYDASPDMWSPYNLGGDWQAGIGMFYEPLVFADMLDGHEYPWLAESWEYNEDATAITYFLRDGVLWSDGEPFTAEDVAYTFNTARDYGAEILRGGIFETVVKEAEVIDDLTVKVTFNGPAPRFHDEVIVAKGDSATFIVPEHIWKDQDWGEYTAFNDGAGPVTTSPWRFAYADSTRRIIDRVDTCEDWWACSTGFAELPDVERFVQVYIADQQGQATALIRNEIDQTHDLRVDLIEKILEENPDAQTWTGREAPYGMTSWWPTSVFMNTQDKHLGNADVRWAINRYVDRDKLIDFAFDGAAEKSVWPFPPFIGLQDSMDNLADLEAEYEPGKFDMAEADALMEGAGYTKNGDGFWADADGETVKCDIVSIPHFSDSGPVIAEMMRQGGIDASYNEPSDTQSQMQAGGEGYTCGMWGHNGSMSGTIYRTLHLYTVDDPNNYTHYDNPEYDAIVEELATAADDATVRELEHQAMSIWLEDLPEIPVLQFPNRTANNWKYWENWPMTTTDPYMNGIHMHTGFPYTLMQLKSTGAE